MLSSTELSLQMVAENTSYSSREVLLAILKSRLHDASKTSGGLNEAIEMLNKWEVTITFCPK